MEESPPPSGRPRCRWPWWASASAILPKKRPIQLPAGWRTDHRCLCQYFAAGLLRSVETVQINVSFGHAEHDAHAGNRAQPGRGGRAGLYQLLRPTTLLAHHFDPAIGLRLWAELADAGLSAHLRLFRRYAAALYARQRLVRHVLEGGYAARSCEPPGQYEFNTSEKEIMEILAGDLDVLLPGAVEWRA